MADLAKLVDELSALTVMEAAELSKMLEEKWGVSAAAAVAVAGAAGAGAANHRHEAGYPLRQAPEKIILKGRLWPPFFTAKRKILPCTLVQFVAKSETRR